ncbi:MAG: M48 family metallopeptidase [Pseudomonadota bacterium]|nr:MAG: M48 family metallopeptidase [Pseudomonadota bacterium]
MLLPESEAITASARAYTQMLTPLAKEGRINNDVAMTERVVRITERLLPHAIKYRPETAKWAWEVKVIDDPKTVNAFCMAGGKMAVYSGLIEKVQPTDDELAQVMGHEIAHALSAHTVERMSIALATNVAITAVAVTQDRPGIALTGAALAAALAIQLPNSRQAETESDRIGIELAARAGYNPYAAASLWDKMGKASGAGNSKFDWLSTHPAPAKRRETLLQLAPQMMPYYEAKGERPVFPLKVSK